LFIVIIITVTKMKDYNVWTLFRQLKPRMNTNIFKHICDASIHRSDEIQSHDLEHSGTDVTLYYFYILNVFLIKIEQESVIIWQETR